MDRWIAAFEYDALCAGTFERQGLQRDGRDGEGRKEPGRPDGRELREKVQTKLHA